MISKKMIVDAEYSEIKRCREEIREFAESNDFQLEYDLAIELSLGEALTNVIEHAQKDIDLKEAIEVNILKDAQKVEVEIKFKGETISPNQLEKSKALHETDEVDELSESGRGVFIIHYLMDKVEYSKDGEYGKIKFTKNMIK